MYNLVYTTKTSISLRVNNQDFLLFNFQLFCYKIEENNKKEMDFTKLVYRHRDWKCKYIHIHTNGTYLKGLVTYGSVHGI